MEEIDNPDAFIWPHFKPVSSPHPLTPWAGTAPPITRSEGLRPCRTLASHEQAQYLNELSRQMSHHSLYGIGDVHRILSEPLIDLKPKTLAGLQASLNKINSDALAYVCIDLERMPIGKFSKTHLLDQLIDWVSLTTGVI